MKKTGRSEGNMWVKIIRSLVIAAGVGIVLCAGLMAVFAWAIVSLQYIPRNAIPALIIGIIAISSLVSGFIAAKMMGKRGLFIGAGCGALLCFLFWAAVLCFGGNGSLQGVLTRIPIFLLGGSLGGYLASFKKRR